MAPVITSAVALDTRAPATSAGESAGFWESSRAAAPAAWGAAMEVPDMDTVAVADVWGAEVMPTPGA